MAVDEVSRFALHERARDALGVEAAATMMELLPPVGWADVARRSDLDQLEERLELKLEAQEHRILEAMQASFAAQNRALVATFAATAVGFGGLLLAAIRLVAP